MLYPFILSMSSVLNLNHWNPGIAFGTFSLCLLKTHFRSPEVLFHGAAKPNQYIIECWNVQKHWKTTLDNRQKKRKKKLCLFQENVKPFTNHRFFFGFFVLFPTLILGAYIDLTLVLTPKWNLFCTKTCFEYNWI